MPTLSIAYAYSERPRLRATAGCILTKLRLVVFYWRQNQSWSKIERLAASDDNTTPSQWHCRGIGAADPPPARPCVAQSPFLFAF